MVAPRNIVEMGEKSGVVDLSVLALPEDDYNRPECISFLGKFGLRYTLKPHTRTEIKPNGTIFPVILQCNNGRFEPENPIDAVTMGLRLARNWVYEGYKFQGLGVVSVANELIHQGDPLSIGGIQTGPIRTASVTWRVDPTSDVKPNQSTAIKQDDGMWKFIGTRTVTNF